MTSSKIYANRWKILGVMCITLFVISIDNTVLNLALPSIATGFQATVGELQWVLDAYTLVFASLLITTGTLGDRYGRKRLFIIGLALFGFCSLGAALSLSINMLIALRALLGVAGAMIMPSTLSILIDVFKEGKERAKAIAIWTSIFSIGAGIGPIIGGLLINTFNWSSVFYLNIPIVAIGILGGVWLVPESKDERAPRPDIPGVSLSVVGLVALVYSMILVGEKGWSAHEVWISLILAVVFLAAFVWWENRSPNPMLPFSFFKNRQFSGANVALTISSFAIMGSMYLFSQYFQSVEGFSPLLSALCMFPLTPVVFLSTMGSVRVNHRKGTRYTMTLGLLLTGLALFLFSRIAGLHTDYGLILLVLIFLGAGIGFTMSPATSAIMNSLPPNRAGIGSAMNDTTRQLGGALGIAMLGAVMNSLYRAGVTSLKGTTGISGLLYEGVIGSVQSALAVARNLPEDISSLIATVSKQAFVNGMKVSFMLASFAMLLAAIAAMVILPAQETRFHSSPDKAEETETA